MKAKLAKRPKSLRSRNANGSHECKRILSTLRRHKKLLQQQYKIKELGVFGSYVRGQQRKTSDVDIVVDFLETPDLLAFVSLADELERVLKRKVDLVRKPVLRKELREGILNETVYV